MTDWSLTVHNGIAHLEKKFILTNYSRCLALLNAVAGLAEANNHHPGMTLEWGTLTITWTTHESETGPGVTSLDHAMAEQCDQLYELIRKKQACKTKA